MSARRQSSAQGFLGACVGIVFNPVPTLRSIVRRRPIGWAILVIVLTYAVQGITFQAVSFDPSNFGDVEWLLGLAPILYILVAPIVAVPVLAFFTAIFWVTSLILGGRGSYCGLFAGLAFASLPTALTRSHKPRRAPARAAWTGHLIVGRAWHIRLDPGPDGIRRPGEQQLHHWVGPSPPSSSRWGYYSYSSSPWSSSP